MTETRHFLNLLNLTRHEVSEIHQSARELKRQLKALRQTPCLLPNRSLIMLFEKASTRTRLSFEIGMHQLGGHAVFLDAQSSQLHRGETIEDTARVMSGFGDAVMVRTFEQHILERLAEFSHIPVINGLTNQFHPCQVLSDIFTYEELRGSIQGKRVAWIGDANNMCNSWIQAATLMDFEVTVSTPPQHTVNPSLLCAQASKHYTCFDDPLQAAKNADIVSTDVWVSMGFEQEHTQSLNDFLPWQVTPKLMQQAHPDAAFMHCLPAHRNQEVDADVIAGPQSVVWTQAENRLHVQKALLVFLIQANEAAQRCN